MILTGINLKNFRSHKDITIHFSDKLNFIVGGNGQGKTSILESVFYLCTTKSHNSSDDEVVRFNENEFEVAGSFSNITGNNIRVFYSLKENKKYYFKDNKQITRYADIIGEFPVVILTPADHAITQGSPSDRRKFVDSVISQASDIYLNTLLDYNKTLRQRSSLLFQIRENRNNHLIDELKAWTQRLIELGTRVIGYRIKFIKEFEAYVKDSYKDMMNDEEQAEIQYSFLEEYKGTNIEERFSDLISDRRDEEIKRAQNLVGPQRDDFIFEINNLNLKTFGSQGQHKTFQVVLRFAEFFYLKEITGKTPIFLLDDVFGELDASRAAKISGCLRQVGQAFITLTDFGNFSFLQRNEEDKVIRLNSGQIVYA
jgi:DNA replication and repair protein RecF